MAMCRSSLAGTADRILGARDGARAGHHYRTAALEAATRGRRPSVSGWRAVYRAWYRISMTQPIRGKGSTGLSRA